MKQIVPVFVLILFITSCGNKTSGATSAAANSTATNQPVDTNTRSIVDYNTLSFDKRVGSVLEVLSYGYELFNNYTDIVKSKSLIDDSVLDAIEEGLSKNNYFVTLVKNYSIYPDTAAFFKDFRKMTLAYYVVAFQSQLQQSGYTMEMYRVQIERADKVIAETLANPDTPAAERNVWLKKKEQSDALKERLDVYDKLVASLDDELLEAVKNREADIVKVFDAMFQLSAQ